MNFTQVPRNFCNIQKNVPPKSLKKMTRNSWEVSLGILRNFLKQKVLENPCNTVAKFVMLIALNVQHCRGRPLLARKERTDHTRPTPQTPEPRNPSYVREGNVGKKTVCDMPLWHAVCVLVELTACVSNDAYSPLSPGAGQKPFPRVCSY